ncbi:MULTISPECIES: DUF4426 domain-containing protein [unclassified Pseudomonas]|uniref:DUF4426 domain-containing protein n=1 Tax=unclassified Pseudomonas TaxID=196821 RepID=UPI000756C0C5|nr:MULTISPECIES: DUF4426 domain-containing protein [unclassified Pseudomonas]KVV01295.1 hypothetical protein AP060_04011 [Pseudomonas sp. TAD18]KVV06380.1 hypothetical protein AP059_02484 [Pseudomonas sp. TAA207]
MGRIGLLLLSMCLGANALAADQTVAQRQQTFGDITVYYNAFRSTFLTPRIANTVGVTRSDQNAVLNITVNKAGKNIAANVQGSVKTGDEKATPLRFREVGENGEINYLAQFPVKGTQTFTFKVDVKAPGATSETIEFTQVVAPIE